MNRNVYFIDIKDKIIIISKQGKKLNQKHEIMEKLSMNESKKLIWLTWFLIVLVGFVVYYSVNPLRWWGLAFAGAMTLVLLTNFLIKSRRIPSRPDEPLPAVFSPTAFITILATFLSSFASKEGIINPFSAAFGTVAIISFICVLIEMRYSE